MQKIEPSQREPEISVLEAKRKLAHNVGLTYSSVIDLALTPNKNPEITDKKLTELSGGLPPHFRRIFDAGVKKVKERLGHNHKLISEFPDNKATQLLNILLGLHRKWDNTNSSFIEENASSFTFREPVPGVLIVDINPVFYKLLENMGVVPVNSLGAHANVRDPDIPSFILAQDIGDKNQKVSNQKYLTHCLVWELLSQETNQGKTTKDVFEKTEFLKLKQRLLPQIVSGKDLNDILLTLQRDHFRQTCKITDNENTELVSYLIACMKNYYVNKLNYLYPIMASSSYPDLYQRIADLTSIGQY